MTTAKAELGLRGLVPFVTGILTAALIVAATLMMFSAFMLYDDEGYVLLSLRNFAQHGALYSDVYSQYGPFPFVFYYALQSVGIPLTHNVGRLITMLAWSSTAITCAGLVGYATRSLLLRVAVLASVFLYLWILSNEPTHPGGLIVSLTALAAALGYRWIVEERHDRFGVLVGAIAAVLLLTKINIGAFVVFSAGSWWLLHHESDLVRRWASSLVIIGATFLALGLMRPLLSTPWVRTYAMVFVASAAATAIAARGSSATRVGWSTLKRAMATGAVAGGVIIGIVMLRGTSVTDLLEGLVLGPMRQPVNFSLRYKWSAGIATVAALSLITCIFARILQREHAERVNSTVAALRLLAAAGLAIELARFPSVSPDYHVFGFALPCVWLFVWRLNEEPAKASARGWLALLLLGQCLHVFPVPGSQIAWGSVLALPLAAIGASEALDYFHRRGFFDAMLRQRWQLASRVVATAYIAVVGWAFGHAALRFRDGQYLRLPGAELIRVPEQSAAFLRVLAQNAKAHADVLFTLPGMFSFNLWTDLPTPTYSNVTHWFSLLDAKRQQAIIEELAKHPRACVIVDQAHVRFLTERGLAPRGALHDYLAAHFVSAFRVGHFEFWVHRGRQITPYLVGDVLVKPDAGGPAPVAQSRLIKLAVFEPPSAAIAAIEVRPDNTAAAPEMLDANNTRAAVVALDGNGTPASPATVAGWPLRLSRPTELALYYEHVGANANTAPATIVFRDAKGAEVGLARLQL